MTLNQHCMHTYNYSDDVTLNVKHSLSLLVCAIMTLEIDLV